MGVYMKIQSPAQALAALTHKPVILNDMPVVTEQDRDMIKKATTMVFSGADTFSNVPSCQCGSTRGGHLKGHICNHCHTPVTDSFTDRLDYLVLIRSPKGVAPLILPGVLYMLMDATTEDSFCYVRWLIDLGYNPTKASHNYIVNDLTNALENLGIERGYNQFVNNFDVVMDMVSRYIYQKRAGGRKEINPSDGTTARLMDMMELLKYERQNIFSDYLPLPNRIALLMEQTSSGTYVGTCAFMLSDVIKSFQGIDTPMREMPQKKREMRTANALITLANYYFEEVRKNHGKKPGTLRRHLYGMRSDYSMRCVISSITEPHNYDEIELPWRAAVATYTIHILNKLLKRGYTIYDGLKEIYKASYEVTPLVSEIFDELLAQSPNGFLYVYFNRNPSLKRGSLQRLKVPIIKRDINDVTIGLSGLNVTSFNADFDGDQMNLYSPTDNYIANSLARLDPHLNLPNDDKVLQFSGMANLPRPALCAASSWYSDQEGSEASIDNSQFVATYLQ
jgi:hypothetical protein